MLSVGKLNEPPDSIWLGPCAIRCNKESTSFWLLWSIFAIFQFLWLLLRQKELCRPVCHLERLYDPMISIVCYCLFGSMGVDHTMAHACSVWVSLTFSGSGFWQISTCIGAVSLDTVWASQWLSDTRDLGNSVGSWPVQHLLTTGEEPFSCRDSLKDWTFCSKSWPCAGQRWRRYALMWMCLVVVEIATQALFILDGSSGVGRNLKIGYDWKGGIACCRNDFVIMPMMIRLLITASGIRLPNYQSRV